MTTVNWDNEPLLGKVPDRVLAEKYGRDTTSVASARRKRGICTFKEYRKNKIHEMILSGASDIEVAEEFNITKDHVENIRRKQLKINLNSPSLKTKSGRKCSGCKIFLEKENFYFSQFKNGGYCKRCYGKWIKDKKQKDPCFDIAVKLRRRLWNAKKKYKEKGIVILDFEYNINYSAIFEKIGPCPGSGHHIDHIIPLSSFDLTNPKEVEIAMAPENHQWLIAEENIKKSNKITQNDQ